MADKSRTPEFQTPDSIVGEELARGVSPEELERIGYDVGRIIRSLPEPGEDQQEYSDKPFSDVDVVEEEASQSSTKEPKPKNPKPKKPRPPKRLRPDLREISYSDPVWREPDMVDDPVDDQPPPSDYIAAQLASDE